MHYLTPLPPELYEVINCALFTAATVVLVLCARYLLTAYRQLRNPAPGTGLGSVGIPALTRLEALYALRSYRLAIGLTVFMLGESPRMGYLWLFRYLQNTGHDVTWLSDSGWMLVPIIGSSTAVLGLACVARAIVPEVWGRYGYFGTLLIAAYAMLTTQIVRDPDRLLGVAKWSLIVILLLVVWRRVRNRRRDA